MDQGKKGNYKNICLLVYSSGSWITKQRNYSGNRNVVYDEC